MALSEIIFLTSVVRKCLCGACRSRSRSASPTPFSRHRRAQARYKGAVHAHRNDLHLLRPCGSSHILGFSPWRKVTRGLPFAFLPPQGKIFYGHNEWLMEEVNRGLLIMSLNARAKPVFRVRTSGEGTVDAITPSPYPQDVVRQLGGSRVTTVWTCWQATAA